MKTFARGARAYLRDTGVIEILEASGLPWEVRQGTKHAQLWIAGRMTLVMSDAKRACSRRASLNAISCVRRTIRSVAEDQSVA